MTRTLTLTAMILATGAFSAQAQTGTSTEGAMPMSHAASGGASASMPHAHRKVSKPDADAMSTPEGMSKKPAKQGAQSGAASAPN